MKNKKLLLLLILENLIFGFFKFFIILYFYLKAFLSDSIIPLTSIEQGLLSTCGVIGIIILDFLVNFIIFKIIIQKKNNISYKNMVTYSLIITLILSIIMNICLKIG